MARLARRPRGMDLRSQNSGFGPGPGGSGGHGAPRGEVEKLSKENFNLKLRIFYLEERVAKLRNGGESDESLEQEILEHKVLLEEKQQELDERNLLLVKARNAIEGLHTDLALCRAELEEARNNQAAVEALREREIEVDSLKHKVRELDGRDRKRLEDILTLNEQIRELESEKKRAVKLDKENLDLREDLDIKGNTLKQREAALEESRAENNKLAHEVESLRAKLIENARSLGDQRSREAELMTKLQESARTEEGRVTKLTQLLKQCEQERDQSERAAAIAERKAEDLEKKLEESHGIQEDMQAKIQRLERENQRMRDTYSTKEHSLRQQGELKQQEMRRELTEREIALKSELAELRGKLSALEFARDEAYQRADTDRERLEAMEAQLQKEDSSTHMQLKEAQAKLAAEIESRKEKETQLREALANSVEREKELRRHMRSWEGQIMGKLDDLLPSSLQHQQQLQQHQSLLSNAIPDQASYSSSTSPYADEVGIEEVGNEGMHSSSSRLRHGMRPTAERPEPRRWLDENFHSGNGQTNGPHLNASNNRSMLDTSFSSHQHPSVIPQHQYQQQQEHNQQMGQSRSRSGSMRQPRSGSFGAQNHNQSNYNSNEVLMRLEDLQELKNAFAKSGIEMERKWQNKLKQIVGQLERTEVQLSNAEGKLAAFMHGMETLSKNSNVHLKGQALSMEKRYNELLGDLRQERQQNEDRIRILEARVQRSQDEKERLHEQLSSARERSAHLEGEVRQVRAELDALRDEKGRIDSRLEELYGDLGQFKENNRVLSLELEDRGQRIQDLNESQAALKQQLRNLRDDLHTKKQTVSTLERKLESTLRKLESRDSQLRESKARLDRALHGNNASSGMSYRNGKDSRTRHSSSRGEGNGNDDFEQTLWRQVEDTERAIRSSNSASQHRSQMSSNIMAEGGLRDGDVQALRLGEEAFASLLRGVSTLVEKTQVLLSRHGSSSYEVRDLLHANHRLAQELQRLGDDMETLHRRFLESTPAGSGLASATLMGSGLSYSTNGNSRRPVTPTSQSSRGWRRDTPKSARGSRMAAVHGNMLDQFGEMMSAIERQSSQLNDLR